MELEALQKEKKAKHIPDLRKVHTDKERKVGLSDAQFLKKRLLDIFIVIGVAPFLIPFCSIISLLIKIDSKGPVLFKQKRVGQDGEKFTMYKFRSMEINSEENGCQFAEKDDQRVTRVGKIIRKLRIDEIPQFLNVIKGEMSVIGPRPEQTSFVDIFNDEIHQYELRHSVKPGITGLAQVQQGYASTKKGTERKLNYDLFYIRNYSFKMDLIIIVKTLKTIFTGFGAR